jgi:hypothetical protein
VVLFRHLDPIDIPAPLVPGFVDVGWVTINQCVGAVPSTDGVQGGATGDLHPPQPLDNYLATPDAVQSITDLIRLALDRSDGVACI